MKYILCLIIFISVISPGLRAQEINSIEKLKKEYESFNYENAIKTADELLKVKESLSDKQLIDIYLIKAVSHYSLGQPELVRKNFIYILEIDKDYKLNRTKVSPKIINIFESLKKEYSRIIESNKIPVEPSRTDTIVRVDTLLIPPNTELLTGSVIRSVLLPGWGHLYSGEKTKGWILSSASAVTLGSLLYYIFDTNNKRNDYLNELDQGIIESKYNSFNSSFKIRNTLIITYALLWVYSQLDLLVFSHDSFVERIQPDIHPDLTSFDQSDFRLSFKINF